MAQEYDYVLVGGGVTSVWAAQNIRAQDTSGSIAIFGDEPHPPYDRPPLSKNMIAKDEVTPDDAYSKYDDFYPKNSIDLHKSTRVNAVDRAAKTITLANGDTVRYGKLLLATGSRPRKLNLPGADRPNVFLLRHIEDSLAIREALKSAKRAVLIGAGYIGVEVAASARSRGIDVAIVAPEAHPWAKFGSAKLGNFLKSYYEKQGVTFHLQDEAVRFEGDGENGAVTTVVTKNGAQLPADVVVIGAGVELNLELAQAAGLDVQPGEGVKVNEYLQTSDPNVWAAGDIAFFNDVALNKKWHAEHHLNAKWQGQAVGKNMAGANQPYDQVAYFFSDEFDIHMVLRGDPQGGKNSVISGDVDGAEFLELYYDDAGRLTMGIAISHEEPKLDALSDELEKLIRARVNIKDRLAEIEKPGFELSSLA